jgi:circadian clock protein KaiC
MELKQKSSNDRISTGNAELDAMCGGGFFRDSVVLVSGATGTGKTLLTTSFVAGGVAAGERCLVFAFEESRDQLFRNAHGWGIDFERMEREGLLRVVCEYPEVVSLEDHLLRMKEAIDTLRPQRFVLDSLSALERVASTRAFREFVIGLVSFAKERQVATVLTSTTPSLTGGSSVTEAHISSITDSILLLRYVELFGEMRRSLAILKMRGSPHDKQFREYTIDGKGLHVGRPFRNVAGILAGNPVHAVQQGELDRLGGMFPEE